MRNIIENIVSFLIFFAGCFVVMSICSFILFGLPSIRF